SASPNRLSCDTGRYTHPTMRPLTAEVAGIVFRAPRKIALARPRQIRFRCLEMMGRAGNAVGQPGFFDLDKRLEAISAKGDPLEALNFIVPFESFRAGIEAVVRRSAEERKSNAGRKPFDAVMMFKILVPQTLYNLADEQVEYQIRDRLSFMRFLGLGLEDTV